MTTTTTVSIEPSLTKNQILERLLKADHITFGELITLLDKDVLQQTVPYPLYPTHPQWPMPYTSPSVKLDCNTSTRLDRNNY
jgi:hypothetical protein